MESVDGWDGVVSVIAVGVCWLISDDEYFSDFHIVTSTLNFID